jgi:hypothetical protein
MKSNTDAATTGVYADQGDFGEQDHARSQDEADMIRMGKAQQTKVFFVFLRRRTLTETAKLRPRTYVGIYYHHVVLMGICLSVRSHRSASFKANTK